MDLWVTRKEWGARRPTSPGTRYARDEVLGIVVHHDAGSTPRNHQGCYGRVRAIQAQHLADTDENYRDIAYSFVVCPHGAVFRARGYRDRTGANGTAQANRRYLAVCVIGTNPAATPEVRAAITRLRFGVLRRYPRAIAIQPHSRFQATACPGDRLRRWNDRGAR